MTILLEQVTVPERGPFEVNLHQAIDIRITAEEARRKVNRWLLDNVTYMMHADPPTLVIGVLEVAWRVPAVFTSSQVGRVGIVGYVDVNVHTGIANNTPERGAQFMVCAQEMAAKLPPYQPGKMKIAHGYVGKNVPRAKVAQLPPDDEE